MNEYPHQQIRAQYDDDSIRVYQAYNDIIADSALGHGTFVSPPFSMTRMTWIKPSFLWMAYRAGWGFKDAGQNRILAIDISREGFEWALANSCSSHRDPAMSKEEWNDLKARTPVRIQWDPERDLHHHPLPHRTIQIGIGGDAVPLYVNQWIKRISDITDFAHHICALVRDGKLQEAQKALPIEQEYVVKSKSE